MPMRIVVALAVAMLSSCAAPAVRESEYNLGVDAYKAKDYAAARLHWSHAIDAGELSAFNNLGYLLYQGLGGPMDRVKGVSLWQEAAFRGHSEAQWHLGQAHEGGNGVPKSVVEAYAWYRCAVASAEATSETNDVEAQILVDARKSLTGLLEHLPVDQFAAAEGLAKHYIERYARRAGA